MSGSVLTAQSLELGEKTDKRTDLLCKNLYSDRRESAKIPGYWGTWVAQSVKCPTSPQDMISWFVGWSPALGSVLTAQSLGPASDSVSPSLSAPPPLTLSLCLKNK